MSIGPEAFGECDSLERVMMEGAVPPAIGLDEGMETFRECKFVTEGTQGIIVPEGSEDVYKTAWTNYEANIKETENPPVITKQPENAVIRSGEKAVYTVEAQGEELVYQWMVDRNDGLGFVNIEGAVSSSYATSEADISCSGFKYKCVVTNGGGSAESAEAMLTVTEAHEHTYSEEWQADGENGEKHEECSICGWKGASDIIAAEPEETETETKTKQTDKTQQDNKTEAKKAESPKTGDNSNFAIWFILMAVSCSALAGAAAYGAKKKKQ